MMDSNDVVIVGSGIGGSSVAISLRKEGFKENITVIGTDINEPYRRPPLSKDYLLGKMPIERTRVKPSEFWSDNSINLIKGVMVESVNREEKSVTCSNGKTYRFGDPVLATGGQPRRLVADFMKVPYVYTLRDLHDVPPIRNRLKEGSHLVVIGGGLIGSEVASSAKDLGCNVTILEASQSILTRLVPNWLGDHLKEFHELNKVAVATNVNLNSFNQVSEKICVKFNQVTNSADLSNEPLGLFKNDTGSRYLAQKVSEIDNVKVDHSLLDINVETDSDTERGANGRTEHEIVADLILVAIGLEPSVEIGKLIGLKISDGIEVDQFGQTSTPNIWAVGDVASMENTYLGGRYRVEHWTNALDHGTQVGKNIMGIKTPYRPIPWCWSDQHGLSLQICGWPSNDSEVFLRGSLDTNNFSALFYRENRLVGAISIGRPAELRAIKEIIRINPYIESKILLDDNNDLVKFAASIS